MTANLTVECIGCKARRELTPGEVSELPTCAYCLLPMVAVSAENKAGTS